MYVSVLPIRGISNTWEGWTTLATGARVATVHGGGPLSVEMIAGVEGARALEDLTGDEDPFAPLFAPRASTGPGEEGRDDGARRLRNGGVRESPTPREDTSADAP
jgi:hypothetical protein